MSAFMRKAALVVGAVALVAATAGAAAPLLAPGMAGAAGIAGVASAATLTAIGTYGGLAAGVLTAISTATAPGMSSQGSQTSFTTNPQSGLPYAMGRTRMSGLRIYAKTNTRPGYTKFNDLLWFGVLLSIGGAIGGIEKFTADNEIVTFDASGNAIGDYHDYQAQKIHLGGQQTSALALTLGGGSAPGWSSAHKLSGITHAMWCLRYNKQGEMYGAGAPEPAWIGKWVKVYDPRLDSTYPGGSGSCRALVESTYVWSDNPGLHALTWALGRWQNGKRTCGIGAPVANIRVAEFVECANVCEANGWKVGGVEWTTDSKWDTLKRILQAGGAIPTQTGAMVGCLVSTPRTAIATIESRHLLDSLSIAATKSRRDRFNSVIPRYVDEDSDWSVISGTAITVSDYVTADKGQRTKEIDYPLVQVFSGQVAKQPGQLAAYDIVNSREAGPINFTTGPEWIGLKTGDVILLNVPEEGLVNQPVLITRRAPDPSTGKVAFSAQTETYAKHAYALGQSTTPPAPFSLTAPDLKPPAPDEANWAAAGTVTGEGLPAIVVTGNSEMPSADAVLIDYKLPADATWTRSAILSANEPVQHVIAPLQSETAYQIRVGYRVEQIDGEFTILAAVTTGVGIISDISDTIGEQQDQLEQLEQDTAAAQANIAAAQAQIAEIQSSVTADFSAVNQAVDALNLDVSG
ncbi:phage tail protein, partial [Sphingobium yanoikuyae]|uniref:phage tail protein n=1 Tax=Sphingobium yanoikuyae TaxID=13690 RepID=UPI0028DB6825